MSTHAEGSGLVPVWTLGDRLRKARNLTGLTVAEFAVQIGVSDRTINNAEGDKRSVRPITLNAWALATGVSREWLEKGTGATPPSPPGQAAGSADYTKDRLERAATRHRARTGAPRDNHRYAA